MYINKWRRRGVWEERERIMKKRRIQNKVINLTPISLSFAAVVSMEDWEWIIMKLNLYEKVTAPSTNLRYG